MSSYDTWLISILNTMRVQHNRYATICILIVGVLGNLLNVFVLSQPIFNKVPTTRYFIAASGASLAALSSGLLARVMSGWTADPASSNTHLCKFQAFTNKLGQTTCSYFLLAAAIDRWFQSSPNDRIRRMSSIKNSTRIITAIILLFASYHSLHAICYEAFLQIPPIKCYAGSVLCRYFENLSHAFVTVLVPQGLMLYFGFKTIQNIRHSRNRIHNRDANPSSTRNNNSSVATIPNEDRETSNRRSQSLTRMLIIQVVVYILLALPAAAQALYLTITLSEKGSETTDVQLAFDRFFFAFTAGLSYLGISLPFYLYTLSGPIFRSTLLKLILKWKCCSLYH